MRIAITIREFLRDLFGSRLAIEIQKTLDRERDAQLQLRQDYERRLQDRDSIVLDYKAEIALLKSKVAQYEMVLIPLSSAAGRQRNNILNSVDKPNFESLDSGSSSSSWQKEQEDWYKDQALEVQNKNEVGTNG